MTTLIQTLISGLRLGSIYALMALGYTMVYGIAKMLNFAHGDIIMVGAYAVISTVSLAQLPGVVGVAVSVVVCVLLGVTIEFLAYRPLRKAQSLAVLITAIGVSYLLQSLALLVFKSEPMAFPTIIDIPSVKLGEVVIDGMTILTLAVTAVIMVSLSLFINKTRLGKAMRAVSEDKDAAELMGISVNRTITMTFAIGSTCRRCKHLLRRYLHIHQAYDRFNARHKGIYSCCFRWYRLDPRRNARRHPARYNRTALAEIYLHPVDQCDSFRRARSCSCCKAHGTSRQEDKRKSLTGGKFQWEPTQKTPPCVNS